MRRALVECDDYSSGWKHSLQCCHPTQLWKLWRYIRPAVRTQTSQPEGTFEVLPISHVRCAKAHHNRPALS